MITVVLRLTPSIPSTDTRLGSGQGFAGDNISLAQLIVSVNIHTRQNLLSQIPILPSLVQAPPAGI